MAQMYVYQALHAGPVPGRKAKNLGSSEGLSSVLVETPKVGDNCPKHIEQQSKRCIISYVFLVQVVLSSKIRR